ncbi:hypothetical protein L249_1016 [Ophiocordyceps polyrhachis-furcata BCC 54312]|uniref:Protein kinase domain-containing protein n=1 Tax=Ophiocordyceps polyrhachis-furcata BCC 54312 TaxID=1330021 RepID=A0A367LG21_9HYPO|nr:hypothetical protein L249_1016 [Ophiocordyceps polyrhachis-furcata BCC 54312]
MSASQDHEMSDNPSDRPTFAGPGGSTSMAAATVALVQPALTRHRSFHNDDAPSAKRAKDQQNPLVDDDVTFEEQDAISDPAEFYRLKFLRERDARLRERDARLRERDARLQNSQQLTFKEYLTTVHEVHYSTLRQIIEKDPSKCTTERGHTRVDGRVIPPKLQIWKDFLGRQDEIFEQLEEMGDIRALETNETVKYSGRQLRAAKIYNESSLVFFIEAALERPTKLMIDEFNKYGDFRNKFNVPHGVMFKSDLNGVDRPFNIGNEMSDQYCCHATDEEGRIIFVSEYKPPHKLKEASFDILKPGLDIFQSIVQRNFVPKKDEDAFRVSVDFTAAVVQIFKDMVRQGIHYGMLTTGETIVFLWFDMNNDPRNLFYHVSHFGESAEPPESYRRTALGQFLAFTLLAARRNPNESLTPNPDCIDNLVQNLEKWTEPKPKREKKAKKQPEDGQPEDEQPENEQGGNSQSSSEGSTLDPSYRQSESVSPDQGERRTLRPRVPSLACSREANGDINTSPNSDDDDDEQPSQKDPPQPSFAGRQGGQQTRDNVDGGSYGGAGAADWGRNLPNRSYCTQACLLGLVNGGQLDAKCPNVALHQGTGRSVDSSHPIDHEEFLQLLKKQLKRTLVQGIKRAGRNESGSTGFLFKATLVEYGYTMVFKGAHESSAGALQHETAVYERLKPIQGKHVPVCLGLIDLRTLGRTLHHSNSYDGYAEIVYLLFLSRGGVNLFDAEVGIEAKEDLEEKATRAFRAIHELGVIQEDVRIENMLVNDEVNGIMVIDFELSQLLERPRIPLIVKQARQKRARSELPEPTSHKRSRKSHSTEGKRTKPPRAKNAGLFSWELSRLRGEFSELSSRNRHLALAGAGPKRRFG